jgi:hypothetical protein
MLTHRMRFYANQHIDDVWFDTWGAGKVSRWLSHKSGLGPVRINDLVRKISHKLGKILTKFGNIQRNLT